MDKRIRLNSTDSVKSVNKKNLLDVQIKHHSKMFPFPSISDTIDQMEQFEKERAESTKYRLILNINPYCTNILFNAVTEIVQNEGTDDPSELNIATSEGVLNGNGQQITTIDVGGYNIKGKTVDDQQRHPLTNTDMVRNTEYSNGTKPFEYHCGYDIFNNHVLRNQTFKLVNTLVEGKSYTHKNTIGYDEEYQTKQNRVKSNFNTIQDIMRYSDGTEVTLRKRTNVGTIFGVNAQNNNNEARHLYLKDDVYEFMDSVRNNLSEENGWWGFSNHSTIPSCEFVGGEWVDMKISKLFNKEESISCGFVEMYPDSTLYSFNPKYNKFQNREEFNWDICITYPFENDDSKDLVCGYDNNGEKISSLLLCSYEQITGTSGQPIIMFRSYVKHNLKIGDEFKLFYYKITNEGNQIFTEIKDRLFTVVNIGDMENNNQDYYFYINDVDDILNELDESELIENEYIFRFVKVINNRDCKYYYRKFKKLPNFKFKEEEITDEIIQDNSAFETYINKNCKNEKGDMYLFSKEQYPMAFSETIYGDKKTQIVFTDTIDIDKLVDNLGRPLTELFITIIKRNKGHKLWYKKAKTSSDLKNIEFSHCFGNVKSGIKVYDEWTDDDTYNLILTRRSLIGDVTLLNNSSSSELDDDITIEKDEYYGDVVELDLYNMSETILSDVYFRFNTEQREPSDIGDEKLNCTTFKFDEIDTDDYDLNGFQCLENNMDVINNTDTSKRLEGYYYKAHYPILMREFGKMKQGSHKEIIVSSCKPIQSNGLFIEVVSALRSGISSNDIVYLCDDENNESFPLYVNDVLSNVRFLISPMKPDDEGYKTIFDIVEGLLHSDAKTITQEDIDYGYIWYDENGAKHIATEEVRNDDNEIVVESDIDRIIYDYSSPKYVLRIRNREIPYYAYKVSANLYLWKDLLTVGSKEVINLQEYPFANGHFYINKDINFYLKRQDPFGYNGLYNEDILPADMFGNIEKENNYEYKDITHNIC